MSQITIKLKARTPREIRSLRERLGLTLDDVAGTASELLGTRIDPTWLSRAERELRPMTPEQIRAICDAIEAVVARREEQAR